MATAAPGVARRQVTFLCFVPGFEPRDDIRGIFGNCWRGSFHSCGAQKTSSNDAAALCGDPAHYYGRNGNVTGIAAGAAQDVIGNAGLGAANQTLRAFAGISGGGAAALM